MKIVKEGDKRVLSPWVGKWRCGTCGCHWEMEAGDKAPQFSSDQRDGDAYHMACPTCGKDVWRAAHKSQASGDYYDR